jgi:imidazolonepropionase
MLIHNISQVLQMTPLPQKGTALGTLGMIKDAAVLLCKDKIEATGSSADLLQRYPDEPRLDAGGCVVLPGLIDPHTHLVFAGDRVAEFEMRLQGKSYMEIMAAGGGITSTVDATRLASLDELVVSGRARTKRMLQFGTTTAEAKTGYGLNTQTEILMLQAIFKLDQIGPLELVPTFLGAHALPKEYSTRSFGYTLLVSTEMLSEVKTTWLQGTGNRPLPFVDVFCEPGAFDLAHSRRILETAKALGFPLKIHADEFENIGGTQLAASLGAVSADHLVKTKPEDFRALAAAGTVAVALPCTPFGLGETH